MKIFRYDPVKLQYIKLNSSKLVVVGLLALFTFIFTLFSAFNAIFSTGDVDNSDKIESLIKENKELKDYIKLIEEENALLGSCLASEMGEGDLIEALIQVESRGNENAVGDKHLGKPSVGVLQIRPIMVREVNRILKKGKKKLRFTLKDRFSREKSIKMFKVWKKYYHSNSSFEKIARCWNGGPNGYKNKSTSHYWNKVKEVLKK